MVQFDSLGRTLFILCALRTLSEAAAPRIDSPTETIAKFYECLLGTAPSDKTDRLFSEPAVFAALLPGAGQDALRDPNAATALIWSYFRQHKKIFLFKGIQEGETPRRARLSYCFIGFSDAAAFFDGALFVGLSAPLSMRGREGVFKEIFFPLERNNGPTGPKYLIDPAGIQVNGILLDPSRRYDRRNSLYDQLGFSD